MVPGLDLECLKNSNDFQCGTCIKANLKDLPYPKGKSNRANRSGELLHIDAKGPIKPLGMGGYSYFVSIVDDFTKQRFIRLAKEKSQFSELVKEVVLQIETKQNRKVEYLRSDNEFRTYALEKFCKAGGRKQHFSVPHSPAQNGGAERSIGLTMESIRKVMYGSGLPFSFWPYAAEYSTFILNCTPSTSVEKGLPYQLYEGKKPLTQFLLPFGAKVFGFVSAAYRINKSLGARAVEGRYLGPSQDQKGFRLWIPSKGKVFVTRHLFRANEEGIITESYSAADFGIAAEKEFYNGAVVENEVESTQEPVL